MPRIQAQCAQAVDKSTPAKRFSANYATVIVPALNVALGASPAGPALAVDADVSLNALVLATSLEALTDEDVIAVSPAVHFALDGLSVPVSTAFPHAPASASASFRPSPQMENLAAVNSRPTPSDASIETSPASR